MNSHKYIFACFTCLALLTCKNETHKIQNESNDLLHFFAQKKYKFSLSKKVIPPSVIYAIGTLNNGLYGPASFEIGDTGDAKYTTLSDVHMPEDKYFTRLNYVLISDSFCLVSYTTGGIGTMDYIDFVKFIGDVQVSRYTYFVNRDTTNLLEILSKNPKPSVTLTLTR